MPGVTCSRPSASRCSYQRRCAVVSCSVTSGGDVVCRSPLVTKARMPGCDGRHPRLDLVPGQEPRDALGPCDGVADQARVATDQRRQPAGTLEAQGDVPLPQGEPKPDGNVAARAEGRGDLGRVAVDDHGHWLLREHPAPERQEQAQPRVLPHPLRGRVAGSEGAAGALDRRLVVGQRLGLARTVRRTPPPGGERVQEPFVLHRERCGLPVAALVADMPPQQVRRPAHRDAEQVHDPRRHRGAAAVHAEYDHAQCGVMSFPGGGLIAVRRSGTGRGTTRRRGGRAARCRRASPTGRCR